jgi:hypothetical protein
MKALHLHFFFTFLTESLLVYLSQQELDPTTLCIANKETLVLKIAARAVYHFWDRRLRRRPAPPGVQ